MKDFITLIIGGVLLGFVYSSYFTEIIRPMEINVRGISDLFWSDWINFGVMFAVSIIIAKAKVMRYSYFVGVLIFLGIVYISSYFLASQHSMLILTVKLNGISLSFFALLIILSKRLKRKKEERTTDREVY